MIPEGLTGRQGEGALVLDTPQTPAPRVLPESARVLRDEQWIKTFVGLIATGVPIASACKLHNLKWTTVKKWLANGREEDAIPEYEHFAMEVDRARAYHETRNLQNIQRAADNGDWRAADRMLVIADPDSYGPRDQKVLHGGDPNSPIEITLSFPSGIDRSEDAIDVESTDHLQVELEA